MSENILSGGRWRPAYQRVGWLLLPLLLLLGSGLPVLSEEGAVQRLRQLTAKLDNFSANFVQTLYDADSTPLQSSSGRVVLQRPGKFHWRIDEPDNQQIVADGRNLWVYDVALEQVTVSPLDERVGDSPLMLLTSDVPLDEQFDISALGSSAGLDWLELLPKADDGDFEGIYIALDARGIAAMELRDTFGQSTQIRFSDTMSNTEVDASLFEFTPPAGVDVIGDPVAAE